MSKLLSVFAILTLVGLLSCGREAAEPENQNQETANREVEPAQNVPATMDTGARPLDNVRASDRADYYQAEPAMTIDFDKSYIATVHTDKGDIVMDLNAEYAPHHVNNFVFLARQGFFDGLTFHRVVPGFVIQGGDPLGRGNGGPGYKVPAEIGLPHELGAVAMARQGDQVNPKRESSGSQFYITLAPTAQLDGAYSVFGKVIQGFEIVQQIAVGDLITRVDILEK